MVNGSIFEFSREPDSNSSSALRAIRTKSKKNDMASRLSAH